MRREDAEMLTLAPMVSGWWVTAGYGAGSGSHAAGNGAGAAPGGQVRRCWVNGRAGNEQLFSKHATVCTSGDPVSHYSLGKSTF